ncbi:MAG: restriction endonuclease subunit S [Anaerolineae bacterium]
MSEMERRALPEGWRWVRLGEVAQTPQYGYTASATYEDTGVKLLRITDIQNSRVNWDTVPYCDISTDERDKYQLREGDILFARTGATTGKSFLIQETPPAVFASYLIRIRPHVDLLLPDYLYTFLQSAEYWDQVDAGKRGGAQPNMNATLLAGIFVPLPPLPEQQRIATILTRQMAAVDKARAAIEEQLALTADLITSYLRQSLAAPSISRVKLGEALVEVTSGVGSGWNEYPVYGATRSGLALAKEKVGKRPERYKLVDPCTVFYNPMRILLGSIALVDEGQKPGITSPDYVVFKGREGVLHSRWFYYWFRSQYGVNFIKTLSRGAVRERLLFKRLAAAEIDLPEWQAQLEIVDKLKAIARLKRHLSDQLDPLEKLPAALLRRAFNGEL